MSARYSEPSLTLKSRFDFLIGRPLLSLKSLYCFANLSVNAPKTVNKKINVRDDSDKQLDK